MNDPIGDMLTRIRNAQQRGKNAVLTPASKLRARVLDVLKDEGYIRGYEEQTGANGHPELTALALFGSPDDAKFRSSMTLFDRAARHDGFLVPAQPFGDG